MLDQRRAKLAQGNYEGNLSALCDQLTSKYSSDHVWSASRLETYKACPFRFFVDATLKLEPKKSPVLGLDAAQRGSVYHLVLELVYTRVKLEGKSPSDILDKVAAEEFAKAPGKFDFRPSALWEVEKAELLEKLHKTVEALEKEKVHGSRLASSKILALKSTSAKFDIDGDIVQIHGLIDRLDKTRKAGCV